MREIKYKAYIKSLNLIVPILYLHLVTEEVEVDLTDGQGHTSLYRFDEVELLQYTGLKDKNGTEIYEGDVFINKWKVGHTSLHRVYFCEKELAFMSLTNLNGDLIKESLAGYAEGHNIRVTGNIYENPELLEVTE